MISEQICEEAQRHESETVHELEEKITELRKLLQDKEYAIQELEKIKPIAEQEGVVIKYREVAYSSTFSENNEYGRSWHQLSRILNSTTRLTR